MKKMNPPAWVILVILYHIICIALQNPEANQPDSLNLPQHQPQHQPPLRVVAKRSAFESHAAQVDVDRYQIMIDY